MCCIYTRTFSIQSAHARHPSIHGTIPSIPTDPCHAPCPDQSFSRGPWSASPAFSNAHPLTPRKRPFPERRLLHAHPPLRYEMPTPPAPRRWCPRLPRLSPMRSSGSPDLPPCCRAFAVSQSHRPHHLAAHLAACLTKSLRSPTPTTNPRVCVCVCVCVRARARVDGRVCVCVVASTQHRHSPQNHSASSHWWSHHLTAGFVSHRTGNQWTRGFPLPHYPRLPLPCACFPPPWPRTTGTAGRKRDP